MGLQFLTVKQVAEQLSVSVIQVRRLITDKQLPAYRLGYRSYRIDPKDLANFKKQKRTIISNPEKKNKDFWRDPDNGGHYEESF